jgi:hypothetical protein
MGIRIHRHARPACGERSRWARWRRREHGGRTRTAMLGQDATSAAGGRAGDGPGMVHAHARPRSANTPRARPARHARWIGRDIGDAAAASLAAQRSNGVRRPGERHAFAPGRPRHPPLRWPATCRRGPRRDAGKPDHGASDTPQGPAVLRGLHRARASMAKPQGHPCRDARNRHGQGVSPSN